MKFLHGCSTGLSIGILLGSIQFGVFIGSDFGIVGALCGVLLSVLFCGFPSVVYLYLHTRSKSPFSQVLLCVASLFYGIWFLCWHCAYLGLWDIQGEQFVLFSGFLALPILLPLWITALVLNSYYIKKASHSVMAVASLSEEGNEESSDDSRFAR